MPLLSRLLPRTISVPSVIGAHAERGLAAVAAMRADGGDVVHLPRAGLVAIGAGGQRADRADVDAHAALFAVQVIARCWARSRWSHGAVLDAQRPDVHAFAAHAHAAVAEDAARPVKEDHGRPLLLFAMLLDLDVLRVSAAPYLKVMSCSSHSPPASQTGQSSGWLPSTSSSMALRACSISARLGRDDHAFGDRSGAGGLQLGQPSQCAPGTCGRRPAARARDSSRTPESRCPRPCRHQSAACPWAR